jgi:hypothetical protein
MTRNTNWPEDSNSRGLGLLLRVAGILLSLGSFFALFFAYRSEGLLAGSSILGSIARVVAYLWAWPYAMYQSQPAAFGAMAVVGIGFFVALLIRADRRGAIGVLVWTLFWGWLLAAMIGQSQGH